MLTDEQLLQSAQVRAVLSRMAGQGLHKTAGAVALGVDEVTLENAVLAICTKIAAQALREQRIASALDSLDALEKTAANPFSAVMTRIRGGAKTVPAAAPAAARAADAIAPVGGGAMRLTGAGDAPIPNKVTLPAWMQDQKAMELPTMRSGMDRVSAPSGAPKTKSKATVEGVDVGEMPSMFRLNDAAGQTTLSAGARKGGGGIMRGGPVAAAQPMNFGRGQVGDQAAPMFNLQDILARGGRPS